MILKTYVKFKLNHIRTDLADKSAKSKSLYRCGGTSVATPHGVLGRSIPSRKAIYRLPAAFKLRLGVTRTTTTHTAVLAPPRSSDDLTLAAGQNMSGCPGSGSDTISQKLAHEGYYNSYETPLSHAFATFLSGV